MGKGKRGAIIESLAFHDIREQLPEATLFRYRSLCRLLPLMKAQRTMMTRVDIGLAGSLSGSALPPWHQISESSILS